MTPHTYKVCVYKYVQVCVQVCKSVCTSMYKCVCTCTSVCVQVHVFVNAHHGFILLVNVSLATKLKWTVQGRYIVVQGRNVGPG